MNEEEKNRKAPKTVRAGKIVKKTLRAAGQSGKDAASKIGAPVLEPDEPDDQNHQLAAGERSKKRPIDYSKIQTEQMEVHHHPEVERKGFKEYILEGLMIFLAVTMGFFAESLREHVNEQNRAKEFAASMRIDLREDSTNLVRFTKRIYYAAANIDTLIKILSVTEPEQVPSGKLYWYGLFGGLPTTFSPHDATLLEMKSSGSLRYFSNPALNRMVAEYDQLLQLFKVNDERQQGIYTEVRKARAQLFDFKYNDAANRVVQQSYIHYRQAPIDSFIRTNPPVLSYNKVIFNQYLELVRSRFLKNQAANGDTILHHASILIKALENEYKLNSE